MKPVLVVSYEAQTKLHQKQALFHDVLFLVCQFDLGFLEFSPQEVLAASFLVEGL